MSTVQSKYLKDENGEVFSPVTSDTSVMLNGGSSLNEFLPKRYIISLDSSSSTFQKTGINVSNWGLIKIYGSLKRSDDNSRALYLELNGTTTTIQMTVDFRLKEAVQDYYARAGTKNADLYLGDIYMPTNSSYVGVEIVRGNNNWHTFHSRIFSQSDESTTDGGVSLCGGQFQQTLDTITSISLKTSGTLQGTAFIEIYPKVEN